MNAFTFPIGKLRGILLFAAKGDYFPERSQGRETIGAGKDAFFETMVFKTEPTQDAGNEGCGCRTVLDWSEIANARYATAGEAQAGHERFVAEYAALAEKP